MQPVKIAGMGEYGYRILGPVAAIGSDGRIAPIRGQPLRLLGLLLVRRGEAVPADVAIDALWGDALPAHPANALQLVVSRLRRALCARAIGTEPDGYVLALEDLQAVDAERFERLARRGHDALARADHVAAVGLLDDALELWCGPALHGIRYEPYAQAEIARLEEWRLGCLGARVDAQLALGRWDRALEQLAGLVVEHPDQQSFRRQLAAALRDGGRPEEAAAAEAGPAPPPADARPARREVFCVAVDLRLGAGENQLDPEAFDDVITRCAAEIETIARRHGDPVLGSTPEGVVAVFGTRQVHEDQGRRAMRAATAIQRRLLGLESELAVGLVVRLGVTTGTVLVVDDDRLPSGEVIGTAARLAREAGAGELVGDGSVRALVECRRDVDVSPLAGREHDLERLRGALNRVSRAGRAARLTLLGEPGIGKSRLVREFAADPGTRARVLVGSCPSYGDGITYWPLREIVQQAQRGAPLAALLGSNEDGAAAAAAVSATLGLGGQTRPESVPWAFRRLFGALARDGPVALVFEDLHWAQRPLLDLLDAIMDEPIGGPLLVLCVGRPELMASRPGWTLEPGLELRPLTAAESRRVLLGRDRLPETVIGRVVARAGGNPLFLEQLAAHVAESGGDGALPPALHALLAARLDSLSGAERELMQFAAVEGEVFHAGGVAALGRGGGESETEAALEGLDRRELLRPARSAVSGQRAFRFRHALVRDVAYASMPMVARAEAHERLAAWLDGLGAAVPEADAVIAVHLERAHEAARALRLPAERTEGLARAAGDRMVRAARDVHERGDLPSEIALLERALTLLGSRSAAGAEALPALGTALFEAGHFDRAEEVAKATVAAGLHTGSERVRRRGEVEGERLRAYRAPESVEPRASLGRVESAAAALGVLGDTLGVARARYLMCELSWLLGRSESGLRNAREVVRLACLAGGAVELDAGVSFVAWALVVNRVPVVAAREECEALQRAVKGRRFAELGLLGFAGVLDAMEGRFEPARVQLARSRAGLGDLGLREASVWMATFAAQVELLAGDPAGAKAALDDAERIAVEIGDRWFLSTILVDRAHVLLAWDESEEEWATAVARIEEVRAPKDTEWLIKRHSARAKLAARGDQAEVALAEARAAVELADESEMFLFRADAWRDLAEVAQRTGAAAEAERARTTALALYRAKGNSAAAERLSMAAGSVSSPSR